MEKYYLLAKRTIGCVIFFGALMRSATPLNTDLNWQYYLGITILGAILMA